MAVKVDKITGELREADGLLAIRSTHNFPTNIVRDSYFPTRLSEITKDMIIAVGSGFQRWTGIATPATYSNTYWIDTTALIKGADGASGAGSSDGPNNTGIVMIKGNPSNPINLDERLRVSNSLVYLERYNGITWEIIFTFGGSFTADKGYLNGEVINGIFNTVDPFQYYNMIRTTTKKGGIDVGDQSLTAYITGKSPNDIFLSYPGSTYFNEVQMSIATIMNPGVYNIDFTWTAPTSEFKAFIGYADIPSKGRMIVKEKLSGRKIWESITKAELDATGGNSAVEALRDVDGNVIGTKTTGYIRVAASPTAYLYQNTEYTATLEVSEGTVNGNGIYPYFKVEGLESVSHVISDRNYVDAQTGVAKNNIFYFRKGAETAPVTHDIRLRKNAQYMVTERYYLGTWQPISRVGGSFTSDKFVVQYYADGEINEITHIDKQGFSRQIWGITTESNGCSYGDPSLTTWITSNARDGIKTSYPGEARQVDLNIDHSVNLDATSFTSVFTATYDWNVTRVNHYLYRDTKSRLMIKDVLENRYIYKTMNDSEYLETGGILLSDESTGLTTGLVTIKLKNTLYFISGRQYEVVIETSQCGYQGNIIPYAVLFGNLDIEETVATREWVNEQTVKSNEITFKKDLTDTDFDYGDYKLKLNDNKLIEVDTWDDTAQAWTKVSELGINTKSTNMNLYENGVLSLEKTDAGITYNAKVCGKATSVDSLSYGDPNRTFIAVSGGAAPTCLTNPTRGLSIPWSTIDAETQLISEFTFTPNPVTKSTSITGFQLKTLDSIVDYNIKSFNTGTGVSNYYAKTDFEYESGSNVISYPVGNIEIKSIRPFWILPNNTYSITIKFKTPIRVKGFSILGVFNPYLVLSVDEFIRDELVIKTQLPLLANEVTGWIKGADISVNALDNTKFDVSPGKIQIIDYPVNPENPTKTVIEWTTTLTSTAGLLGTNRSRWVAIKDNGSGLPEIVVQASFSSIDKRSYAVIGKIRNSAGAGPVINAIDDYENPTWNLLATVQDFVSAKGSFSISGNTIAPTSTLQLTKTTGTSWRYHAEDVKGMENIHNDTADNPRTTYTYLLNGVSTTTALTALDPNFYDLNGVKTPTGVGNAFTKQEIYIFPVSGSWFVFYGDKIYATLNEAVLAEHRSVSSVTASMLEGAYHAASIVMKQGITNMTTAISTDLARIIPVTASASSVPLSLPGIYQGSTISANGITGTVPAATIAERNSALFGDGTFKPVISVNADNAFTGQNVFYDSKFFIRKASDATATVAFNTNNVPTATTRAIDIPKKDGTMAVLSDVQTQSTSLTERNANTLEKPSLYSAKRYYDSTTNKMLLYRMINSNPSYNWMEDDGIEEFLYAQSVPSSPTNGQVFTSTKGYVYTYNSTNSYWVLTTVPGGTGGGSTTQDYMFGSLSGSSIVTGTQLSMTQLAKTGDLVITSNSVTLKANRTYNMSAGFSLQGGSSGQFTTFRFYKSDGTTIGSSSEAAIWHSSGTGMSTYTTNPIAKTILYTPTIDTNVIIKCAYSGGGSPTIIGTSGSSNQSANDGGDSWFEIQQVGLNAIVNNTVKVEGTYIDYVHYTLNANSVNLAVNNIVPFSQLLTSNSTGISQSNGSFTLKANITYDLEAYLSGLQTVSNNIAWGWFNSSTGVQLPNSSVGAGIATTYTNNYSINSPAKCIVTPTADMNVDVRMTYCSGTFTAYRGSNINGVVDTGGSGGSSYLTIKQLGSKAVYVDASTTITNKQNYATVSNPTPVNNDLWSDGTDLFYRSQGVTKNFTSTNFKNFTARVDTDVYNVDKHIIDWIWDATPTSLTPSKVALKMPSTSNGRQLQFAWLIQKFIPLLSMENDVAYDGIVGTLTSTPMADSTLMNFGNLSNGIQAGGSIDVDGTVVTTVPTEIFRLIIGTDGTNIYYVNAVNSWDGVNVPYSRMVKYETGDNSYINGDAGTAPLIRSTTSFTSGTGLYNNTLLDSGHPAIQYIPIRIQLQ